MGTGSSVGISLSIVSLTILLLNGEAIILGLAPQCAQHREMGVLGGSSLAVVGASTLGLSVFSTPNSTSCCLKLLFGVL